MMYQNKPTVKNTYDFNCGLIPAPYKLNYIVILTTLKMAACVVETCR
jgi:hypothetical protein